MRELTSHKVNGCNGELKIEVLDEPGSGGAHHLYRIGGLDNSRNKSVPPFSVSTQIDVLFQNGPIKEVGTNGVTHEALLAILIDRLECFQKGPFACDENRLALAHLFKAQAVLKSRTEKRLARGVEGTHTV